MLRIYTLGRFEVRRGRHRITEEEWRTETHKTLLKALLTEPGRMFTCDELIERLWPEVQDPERKERNLRARVSELRRILEPHRSGRESSYIRTAHGGYRLELTGCRIDFLQMEELYEQGQQAEAAGDLEGAIERYREAVGLYRGEFLPDDRHREWTHPQRERLRSLYLEGLRRLVSALLKVGRREEAVEYAERALLADPYDEVIYRSLMRLHHEAGRPGEALKAYESCLRVLRELDVEPSQETQRLAEMIRGSQAQVQPSEQEESKPRSREKLEEAADLIYRDPGRAVRLAEEARRLFRQAEDLLGEAQALQTEANAEISRSDLEAAERALAKAEGCLTRWRSQAREDAIDDKEAERADRVQMGIWAMRAQVMEGERQFEKALQFYDRALRLAEACGFFKGQAQLLLNMGAFHYERGHLGEAGLHWARARRLAGRLGLGEVEAKASNNLALLKRRSGDLEGARALYERAIELLELLEDLKGLADAWNNLGIVEDILGRLDEAEAAYTRSLELDERRGDPLRVAIQEMNLGGLAVQRRRYREARERLELALRQFRELKHLYWEAESLKRLGWLHQERGRHEEALACFEEGLRRVEEASLPELLKAQLESYSALSLAALGRRAEALKRAEEVERVLKEEAELEPTGYGWVEARYRLWRAFELLGERERAKEQLGRAYRALRALGERLPDSELKRGFWRVKMHREIRKAWEGLKAP
jgi:DNA-binding SARP family transcriptional activator